MAAVRTTICSGPSEFWGLTIAINMAAGCQSLPWMESWDVQHPGRIAFSEEEIARNPIRAELR